MEIFFLNVLLKSLLVSEGYCDRDQVELEAMVLDYPKFYNHEYSGVRRIFQWGGVFKSDIKNLFAIYTLANK